MSAFEVELYLALHRGTPGDVDWYIEQCAKLRVLELGCGDLRVAARLLETGCTVTGVESNLGMLAAARARLATMDPQVAGRVTLVEGDMQAFAVEGRFDRIIVPYTGLFCLPDDEAVVACFECAARHLAPGGQLLFDGYLVDEDCASGVDEMELICTLYRDGYNVAVSEQSVHDREAQTFAVTYHHAIRHAERGEAREHVYTLDHHYVRPSQVERLLARAGLRVKAMYGDFEGGPLDDEAERLVVVAVH